MRRFMLALVALVMGLLMVATVASAHIQHFNITEANRTSPTTVNVRGVIQCTEGEQYTIRVTLTQPGAQGQGVQRGFCTGEPQIWQVTVQSTGGEFQEGPAEVCARATTRQLGTTHRDAASDCETVQVQNAPSP